MGWIGLVALVVGSLIAVVAVVAGFRLAHSESADPSLSPPRSSQSPPQPRTTKAQRRSPSAPPRSAKPTKPAAPRPDARTVAAANRLYDAKAIGSVHCHESKSPLDNQAHVIAYYQVIKKCLDRTWPAVVKSAGYTFHQPKAYAWSKSIDTPCGTHQGTVSFYCPANQTLYLSIDEVTGIWRQYPDAYGRLLSRLWATHVMSHEYAHHIQQVTGIFPAYTEQYRKASSRSAQDRLERRSKLQASCLGQAVVSANRASYPIPARVTSDWRWRVIQIPNHGSPASQRYWITRGYGTRKPGSCNTFAAANRHVT